MCYAALMEDRKYSQIARTVLDEGQPTQVLISTVWVGLDMGLSMYETHIKLIFETMIFLAPEAEDKYLGFDVYQQRYPHRGIRAGGGTTRPSPGPKTPCSMNAKEEHHE